MTKENLSHLMIICGAQKEILENQLTATSKVNLIELNQKMEAILMGEYDKIKTEISY